MHARDLGTVDALGPTDDPGPADVPDAADAGSSARSDDAIRRDLLRLVEGYSGEPGGWEVRVEHGEATVRRNAGRPGATGGAERLVVRALAHAVAGVVSVRVPGRARATVAVGIPA